MAVSVKADFIRMLTGPPSSGIFVQADFIMMLMGAAGQKSIVADFLMMLMPVDPGDLSGDTLYPVTIVRIDDEWVVCLTSVRTNGSWLS